MTKQPKKCALCGCLDERGEAETCFFCGEATWVHAPADPPKESPPTEPAAESPAGEDEQKTKKRGRK